MILDFMIICDAYFQTSGALIKEVDTLINFSYINLFCWKYESHYHDDCVVDFMKIVYQK